MSRRFHDYSYVLVTLLISLHVLTRLDLHAEEFAGLRPGRNFHLYLAVQSRHVDFGAQGRLDETYGNFADNV